MPNDAMPEMDRFTAPLEIRRRKAAGELTGHLPIIALTANTTPERRPTRHTRSKERPVCSAQLRSNWPQRKSKPSPLRHRIHSLGDEDK